MVNKKQPSFQPKKDTGKRDSKESKGDLINEKENRMDLYYKNKRTQLYKQENQRHKKKIGTKNNKIK